MTIAQARIVDIYNKGYRVTKEGVLLNPKGKELKPTTREGYKRFTVRTKIGHAVVLVHRLQAYSKFGKEMFKEGIQVRHLNGNSLDNSFENIAIGTASQNAMDKDPEVRLRAALKATETVRKYNKEEVKEYYKNNGWAKTIIHFSIPSKGTLSFLINS